MFAYYNIISVVKENLYLFWYCGAWKKKKRLLKGREETEWLASPEVVRFRLVVLPWSGAFLKPRNRLWWRVMGRSQVMIWTLPLNDC